MEFASKVTEAEFAEFQRMTRSTERWFNLFLACIGGPLCIWQSVLILSRSPTLTHWAIFILGYAAMISLLVFAHRGQKRRAAEQLAELNAQRDRFIFTNEGVQEQQSGGATKLVPWRGFKDWREGQQILLLNTYSSGTIVLPIADVSEHERQLMRQFIQSHVSPTSIGVPGIHTGTKSDSRNTGEVSRKPPDTSQDDGMLLKQTGIEFTSRLTEAEFGEYKRMTRTLMYWLGHLIANILWFSMFGVFIGGDLFSKKPHLGRDAYIFILFAGGYVAYLFSLRETEKKRLDGLNGSLEHFNLTEHGVKWHAPSGKEGLLPWDSFYGWTEGKQVIVLNNSAIKFVVLPITKLPPSDRRSIQQFLSVHISPAR